jgi:hypothetical protein
VPPRGGDGAARIVLPGLANGLKCPHTSTRIAALQTNDVGLRFIDVSPQFPRVSCSAITGLSESCDAQSFPALLFADDRGREGA